ncbi:MAG: isoleucine--tRNA ligase [Desulfurococcales archaeon]|nr:isoleucine--tRNA ligase [Desulfurococcales archaeon]
MSRVRGQLEGAYNPHKVEDHVHKFWEENGIYHKVKEKSSKSKKKYYFLDGPPYPSSSTFHIGTAWNKTIKDSMIRFFRMKGYNVWDQPGYDTHGLPIEVKIEKELGLKTKKDIMKIGIDKFVTKCMEFAKKNVNGLTSGFKDLGVFMDWENPYLTFKNDYIESGWWMIKRANEEGLLEKDLLVHHWCPRCETTLADYEVSEYKEIEDPSIYVKFKVKGRDKTYIVIWTTTPWTLPANAFVMAHPEIEYAEIKVEDETLILSKARAPIILKQAGVTEYRIARTFKGVELEGVEYKHPLEDEVTAQRILRNYHKVILAPEAVTEHEGTGLVHSAPGHGDVDFEVARENDVPIISLVGDQGNLTEGGGKYAGLYFRDANKYIIDDLKKKGAILYETRITHKYPVCWRCKTPLLLRATEQWVIRVSRLKDKLIEEAESITWQPEWAKTRFINLLKNVRDWVISRQRFWGIPLPLWVCKKCGHIEVIGSIDDVKRLGGKVPENLHRPWIDKVKLKCPKCGGEMERIKDVTDVWFDSGISFYASLGYPRSKKLWESLKPVDFITEGHDQIRGWFFSLLRSGVITFGSKPYNRVLVHGFTLDEHGFEMHKSLGNYVELTEVINRMGRDVFRWWAMMTTTWEDMKFSWNGMEKVKRDLSIVWNVYNFALTYMSLDSFDPTENTVDNYYEYMKPEDKWILSRLHKLIREYEAAMYDMKPHEAARAIREFIVEDVSRWYLRLIRRRVWIEEDTVDKRTAYTVLYSILNNWLVLAAPFIPFITEKLYRELVYKSGDGFESVHLENIPSYERRFINEEIEEAMNLAKEIIEAALAARMKAGIKIRRPVKKILLSPIDNSIITKLEPVRQIVLEVVNAKRFEVVGEGFIESQIVKSVEPNYSAIGPEFKKKSKKIAAIIKEKSREIADSIVNNGYYTVELGGGETRLEPRHVKIKAEYPTWLSVEASKVGLVAIDSRLDETEILEGLAREIVRRVQFMRKEMGLGVEDSIKVSVTTDDPLISKAINEYRNYLMREVRAIEIADNPLNGHRKEWDIDGVKVTIAIEQS